ncbi:hypothetical protein [Butyricimonas virosa]|uniref:hypothetical protein n=1 Tax=Butyricimonas virosa TaxID=544645 RepID=UPI0024320B93|nr:hypothetical protein [Butyricimonas virosa]
MAVITVFIGGRSLNQAKAEKIVCAFADHEKVENATAVAPVQKVASQDTIFGPVSLPEVKVNVKRKVNHVI